jgi:hypothetical protein
MDPGRGIPGDVETAGEENRAIRDRIDIDERENEGTDALAVRVVGRCAWRRLEGEGRTVLPEARIHHAVGSPVAAGNNPREVIEMNVELYAHDQGTLGVKEYLDLHAISGMTGDLANRHRGRSGIG